MRRKSNHGCQYGCRRAPRAQIDRETHLFFTSFSLRPSLDAQYSQEPPCDPVSVIVLSSIFPTRIANFLRENAGRFTDGDEGVDDRRVEFGVTCEERLRQ